MNHSSTRSNRPRPQTHRIRRTRPVIDTLIELEIVPGPQQRPVVVRARQCAPGLRGRIIRRGDAARAVVSWPMATVARLAVPPRRRADDG